MGKKIELILASRERSEDFFRQLVESVNEYWLTEQTLKRARK